MTCLEQEVLARLPKSELRPHDLVTAALSRIGYAKSLFGRIHSKQFGHPLLRFKLALFQHNRWEAAIR